MAPHVEDRDDMGMIEVCGRLRLGAKSAHLGLGGELPGEDHLQRHHPIEAQLPGLVYHPHPAAGQLLDDLIVADLPVPHGEGERTETRVHSPLLDRARRSFPAIQNRQRVFHEVVKVREAIVVIPRRRPFAGSGPQLQLQGQEFLE